MFQAVGQRYELERGRILGHGAFAIVFRGRDKQVCFSGVQRLEGGG